MKTFKALWQGSIYRIKGVWGKINKYLYKQPKVLNSIQSLEKTLNEKCSISRFGDGEFNLIRGKQLGFQKANSILADRLLEVLTTPLDNLEIGLPDIFGNLHQLTPTAARFWYAYMADNRKELLSILDLEEKTYLNSLMTRFWTGYKDKSEVKQIVSLYKKIWQDRDVVFVEGELTRMGVGNDLFSGASSIKRILCPAKNAWDRYDEILKTIVNLNISKDTLFILALGPTATVLAYDLTKQGYQALDLGHLDVQYEYSLRNAKGKIALEGKYVNESIDGRVVSDSIVDDQYLESIVARIN